MERKQKKAEEDCLTESIIICIVRHLLLGWYSEGR